MSEILISTEPATGAELWRGPVTDAAGIAVAVARARAAGADWGATTLEARVAVATRYAALATDGRETFARLIARETGKPFWEALTEVASTSAKIAISVKAQAERAGVRESETDGLRQALRHRPHGVLAVLGPYNFPAHLPNGHIVPALLAGNAVVFKPSEQTPAVGEHMVALWRAAGLPDGVLTLVQGGADTGRALAADPGIDGLLFTGSAVAGAALARQYAETPWKMLALEMGGNNPLIVWDAADAEAAATVVAQSAFISAGQRCTCARRLILSAGPQGERVLEAVLALTDRLIVGAPFDEPQPFMGPVIANPAADRILAGQEALLTAGAHALRGTRRIEEALPFLTPGVIDVTEARRRPDDELFGPLLQVVRVADFAMALDEANATRFGLAAGLVSDDAALYARFWRSSRAGVVNWNRPLTGASSAAPFGGVGASGNHRPSAYYAADYCAWPVASLEQPALTAQPITQGLRT